MRFMHSSLNFMKPQIYILLQKWLTWLSKAIKSKHSFLFIRIKYRIFEWNCSIWITSDSDQLHAGAQRSDGTDTALRRCLLCRWTHTQAPLIALDSRAHTHTHTHTHARGDAIITQSNSCFVSTTPTRHSPAQYWHNIAYTRLIIHSALRRCLVSLSLSLIRLMRERATVCLVPQRDNGPA
jgi:hypothetical protein